MPGKVHLTVPPSFRKKAPGGCILHVARLVPHDIEHHQGFNATTPLRTLLDAADGPLSPDLLEGAVRDALRRGMVRREQLLSAELPQNARDRLRLAVETAERVEVA
ncbi:MAG: hypothetical protein HY204_12515 [Nitrospirae bacterium]|nr:hypothetical protein [Nitrospirota bacterium]